MIKWCRDFLDQTAPLIQGSHHQASHYAIKEGTLAVTLDNHVITALKEPEKLIGFQGEKASPETILLKNNGLHIEIQRNKNSSVGQSDYAGISDIVIEAALTTIMDCEDSVAAVDVEDKVLVYRNWLGLIKGELNASFIKKGKHITRCMNSDRHYQTATGSKLTLPGRSLMLIRNVGHLMTTDAVLDCHHQEIPEGILDGFFTALIASHDRKKNNLCRNSRTGSIYIVKPKMHGPEEVAFTCDFFHCLEQMLNLPEKTIKLGIMDEERRTSINLKACIHQARDRVIFINTGFLDRTGDEIHTSIKAGPVVPKNKMKNTSWIQAYEKRNVEIGLKSGFTGKAQIGKGMWPMPDRMADMLDVKIEHLLSGANTAWVPSPTAAALHALHYHKINVVNKQKGLIAAKIHTPVDELLSIPLQKNIARLTPETIQNELENNAQGILGYVVRWVNQGIGCSKVPDINNIGLMEDRATLRISSQHMANWLYHGICTEQQIMDTLKKMARVVDQQNVSDPDYVSMAPDFNQSVAFQTACDLIFKGQTQPNGYTEPLLHQARRKVKKLQQIK
ncbi:Malate synthase G [invertebrate metagenome]|uniref:Malate synthase G n=1 Tax=invertebrate metagenome TaxID=1711999 RepID=A0A2H9T7S0_9ZZZZ